MSVLSTDIVCYAAASKPEDDSSTTQTITVRARQEDGTIDQQAPILTIPPGRWKAVLQFDGTDWAPFTLLRLP